MNSILCLANLAPRNLSVGRARRLGLLADAPARIFRFAKRLLVEFLVRVFDDALLHHAHAGVRVVERFFHHLLQFFFELFVHGAVFRI